MTEHKRVVKSFFDLVMQGKQKETLRFFSPNCRQHNPYVKGGMDELFDSMSKAQQEMKYPDPRFEIKSIVAEGDLVAAHTEILMEGSRPEAGGLRQIHLFRFGEGGRIVEYWDVSQMVLPEMSNPANAF